MNFTVQAASLKKELPDNGRGAAKIFNLTLLKPDGEVVGAEWFTKATTDLPAQGSTLEGDLEQSQYGLKFKKAGGFPGGGGGGRKDSPETRRSIALQASHKVAVEAVRVAVEAGLWKPEDPAKVVAAVLKAGDRLYLRIQDAEADRIKAES